jgi:two-component system cell cycle sensor histidine kinase/response regulator CckA
MQMPITEKTKIRQIISHEVITVTPETPISEAIAVMAKARISCVVVADGKKLLGIFTERDIVKEASQNFSFGERPICELMSSPVVTISDDLSIYQAYDHMFTNHIRHHVVVDSDMNIVGVLTQSDIINHLGLEYFVEMRKIEQIMTPSVATVASDITICEVLIRMAEQKISCVVVADGHVPVGILTERDIVRMVSDGVDLKNVPIRNVMSSPVRTVVLGTTVHNAAMIMKQQKMRRIVVVDQAGGIKGIITQSDIVKGLEAKYIESLKQIIREKENIIRKTAKELLDKSVYLDNILNSSIGMAIIATDSNLTIKYFNQVAEKLFGYSAEYFIGRSATEIHCLKNIAADRLNKALEIVKKQGEHTFSTTMIKDGVDRFYDGRVTGILDRENQLEGYVLIFNDNTDRKRSEDLLRQSEEKFSTAFRASPDALSLTRLRDGIYKEVNEGFTAILGYQTEDVIGKSSHDLGVWADSMDLEKFKRELKKHGIVKYLEAQLRRKDGSIITGQMSARTIMIDGEQCHLNITRDVTQNKQAEQALRESERTLRTLMESMPASVWWFDNDGNIEYLNRCFVEQFGYTLDDIPTLNDWFERAYPDPEYRNTYVAERNDAIAAARKGGKPVPPREAKITCKDGTVRHVIINNYIEHHRTLAILTDITEQKIIHDQVLKMQKLESLGVLAGGIAHDFNNILTSILGNISFAQMFLDKTHKAYRPLEQAEKGSMLAAELASQLLTFAKGGLPIKKFVKLQHLIGESVSLVLRGANVKGVIDIPISLHAIEADEGQLSQAFNNLIINAVQAMPGGGTLYIHGKNVTLPEKNKFGLKFGEYVCLSFKDEGCGIPEAELGNIFDPYFTTKSAGTGLGLASTHSIISKHEGIILVKSKVGKGTTLTIYLPSMGETLSEDSKEKTIIIGNHTGGSILVMDDDEMIRDLTGEILSQLGYEFKTCVNGSDAVSQYKAAMDAGKPFSAVIMDLTIPGGMGGKEAAKHILDIDPKAELIVSSGYSNDPVMAEYKKYGFYGAVVKPYKVHQLAHVLSELRSDAKKG